MLLAMRIATYGKNYAIGPRVVNFETPDSHQQLPLHIGNALSWCFILTGTVPVASHQQSTYADCKIDRTVVLQVV